MKKLSVFDIAMIIAFVVIGLLGGAAWYYFSAQLAATQQTVSASAADFTKYTSGQVFLPTANNVKTVQANIDLINAQLDPIIKNQLQNPANKLPDVAKEDTDTVKWKQHLDEEVGKLNAAAKTHGVTVPANFYYGFSRYLNANPANDQIVVLSKQLLGVVAMADIFINSPVRQINTFRRTAEEEPNSGTSNAPASKANIDILPGHSSSAAGDVYTAYPFEIEFESDTTSLRKVVNDLLKSPYIFVIRSVVVQNEKSNSPQVGDLDKMMGNGGPDVADSSPGSVGANKSDLPPQWLFGKELLHVKLRVDMIEWNHVAEGNATPAGNRGGREGRGGRGGRNGGGGGFGGGAGGNE
jgi:uncharacterized membrane protein YgcG